MKLSLTLSKYIGKQFLLSIGLVFSIVVGLIMVFDSLEIIRKAYAKNVPFHIIIELVLMKLPTLIQEIIPFAVLIGGILTFSKLTRTSELVVTRAAGISVWQFLMPTIIITVVLGMFIMMVFNPLAATMLTRFEQVEAKYLRGSTSMLSISSSGLWLREETDDKKGKNIIHALRVSQEDMALHDITIYIFKENNTFTKRIDAQSAKLRYNNWELTDLTISEPGSPAEKFETYQLPTNLSAHQIHDSFASPQTLSFWELPEFIKTLKGAGFSALRHALHWHTLLVTPFFLSAMVLFAAAFSLSPPRFGKTGLLISLGICVGFLIYFLSDLIAAIGLSGTIPIPMAAWIPVIIILLSGVALILHLEDG